MKLDAPAAVLLVDDDETFRQVMATELIRRGHEVRVAACGGEALEQANADEPEVVLLDLRLPDMTGIEVLERLQHQHPGVGVIVLTGHGSIDTAIQAMRLGADDYLEKPCPIEKLEVAVSKTCEHMRLLHRRRVLEDGYSLPEAPQDLVGSSPAFLHLLGTVARIARTDSSVLIQGETGCGKERVAMLVHAHSARRDQAFVVVDCASLHEELLQSELFGHERGSFTGATRQKHGLFEVATGGTMFLDEVGEASPEIQAKLLRVLETGRFRRLGGTREISVDVRVVSATNRDLPGAIERGHFREDLFYRLATLTIEIPPLRQRPEDIELLVEHFCGQFNIRFDLSRRFLPDALQQLLRHPWPGNVRELIHVVEQAIVLSDQDEISATDLPSSIGAGDVAAPPAEAAADLSPLAEVERRHILAVLDSVDGNRAKAARVLQVSERNLYRRLLKYGVKPSSRATPRAERS